MHLCDVTDYHIFAGSPVCHHQAAQSSQCPSTGKTEPWWQRDRLSVPNPEHGLIHALPPGKHHYLEEKQNNNALNINYHRIYILNLQAFARLTDTFPHSLILCSPPWSTLPVVQGSAASKWVSPPIPWPGKYAWAKKPPSPSNGVLSPWKPSAK